MLGAIVTFFLKYLIFAMMLSIGLASRPRDLVPPRSNWRAYLRSLLAIEIAVPLLALAIVATLRIPRGPSILILLMAGCPGAPFIPMATKIKGERHSQFGLHLLLMLSLLSVVTLPIWIWILGHLYPYELQISIWHVVEQVMGTVLVPFALGLALRHFLPRAAAVLAPVTRYFFLVALVVAIVVILYLSVPVLRGLRADVGVALLLLVVGSELIGYVAGSPDPEQRRVTAVAAALGNPGLALAVVAASFPGFQAAAFMAAFVLFRKLALVPLLLWMKHKQRTLPPSAQRPAPA